MEQEVIYYSTEFNDGDRRRRNYYYYSFVYYSNRNCLLLLERYGLLFDSIQPN